MAMSPAEKKRMAALRRKRGRMLGAEGPKLGDRSGSTGRGVSAREQQRRAQGAKANRQAKAEYIRKKPRGDGARLKPRNTPARSYMRSGKKK